MWEQQSKFWMEFQQQLKQTSGTTQLPAETEEYKLEVRHLFSLRGQVLPQHRDDYFPRRLAEFLEQSTPSQLKTYITNYKPAIRESIREALKRSTNSRRIYQFPGFRRHDLPSLDSETIPPHQCVKQHPPPHPPSYDHHYRAYELAAAHVHTNYTIWIPYQQQHH